MITIIVVIIIITIFVVVEVIVVGLSLLVQMYRTNTLLHRPHS